MTDENRDWKSDRIGSALRGRNPTGIRRLDAGFAVAGDGRFLPGYTILLTDRPGVQGLSDLPRPRRIAYLEDLDRLGEAVERACRAADPAHALTAAHDPIRTAIGAELDALR
ncbi:hypothetical protein [Kitasatospora sp. NPDC088351]|uniref:hypothetical protein n=1 Tax=Kitasatospora sp. NPDC088351 TaxID=3155180 RepID=UPI0034386A03